MNPYEVLGVRRNATERTIKRAYRRHARDAHPDANPGDPTAAERFNAVQRAYDLLSDPARRARYDADGDTAEPKPTNPFDFVDLLQMALSETLNRGGEACANWDLVDRVRTRLKEMRREVENHLAGIKKSRAIIEKNLGRIKTPAGQTNLLEHLLKEKLRGHDQPLQAGTAELDRLTRALAYLDGCTCAGTKNKDGTGTVFGQLLFATTTV